MIIDTEENKIKIVPATLSCKACDKVIDNPGRLPEGWTFQELELRGHPALVCDDCTPVIALGDELSRAAAEFLEDISKPERVVFGSARANELAQLQRRSNFYQDKLYFTGIKVRERPGDAARIEISHNGNVIPVWVPDLPALIELLKTYCPDYEHVGDLV